MKRITLLPLLIAVAVVAGCQSTSSSSKSAATSKAATTTTAAASSVGNLNTTQLIDAFKNADSETVQLVQNAAKAIGSKDWSGALGTLQKIKKIPGLTAAQADAVNGLIGSLSAAH